MWKAVAKVGALAGIAALLQGCGELSGEEAVVTMTCNDRVQGHLRTLEDLAATALGQLCEHAVNASHVSQDMKLTLLDKCDGDGARGILVAAANQTDTWQGRCKEHVTAATALMKRAQRTKSLLAESIQLAKSWWEENQDQIKEEAQRRFNESVQNAKDHVAADLESSCIEDNVAYHPLDMKGTAVSSEEDINACISRCKKTEGCAHFTYFKAHRACHVQDAKASKAKHSRGAQAGKPECKAGSEEEDGGEGSESGHPRDPERLRKLQERGQGAGEDSSSSWV